MDAGMLGGIIGRRAGSAEGFDEYTEELKISGIVWSEQTLDRFLADTGASGRQLFIGRPALFVAQRLTVPDPERTLTKPDYPGLNGGRLFEGALNPCRKRVNVHLCTAQTSAV